MSSQSRLSQKFRPPDSQYKDEDWYNGSIKCITLENFMCHSHFHLAFNPRVNFVSGLNGSGKSAIQTALVVGLGARASVTNRAINLQSFIKYGCSSASISITLANGGKHLDSGPFRPEVYGNQITIVRQFSTTTGTSPYKFLNEYGQPVKGYKQELQNLVLHFNILVENPVCVMNQQMVKIFHKNANSKAKYDLFYKAISANVYKDNIEETKLIAQEHWEKFQNMKSVLTQCYKEINDYEIYENKSKKLEILKNVNSQFENEYAWKTVLKHEKMYKDCLHEIETLKDTISNSDVNTNILNKNIRTHSEVLEKKCKEITDVEDNRSGNHFIYVGLTKELKNKTKERDLAKRNVSKYDNSLKLLIIDKNEFQRLLEFERNKGNTNNLAQLKEKLVSKEKEISDLEAVIKTNMEHEHTLRNTVENLKEKIGNLQNNEVAPLQRRIFELNKNVKSRTQQQDRTSFYGNWMPTLVKSVEIAFRQNKFAKKPLGPIGAYIKVNNDKWIFAIENHLGRGNLSTFLVDNFKDNKMLQSIMEQDLPRNIRRPTIITSKFVDKVHNIGPKDIVNSIFRMLTFTNPVVANCLIDNNRIETIRLVDSTAEAVPLMENESRVPKNCNFCLTLDGTQIYPSPSYRVYSLQHPTQPILLQSDVSAAVASIKRSMEEQQVKLGKLTEEISKLEQTKSENQQLLKKTQSDNGMLKAKYDECVKTIKQLKAKCEEEQDDRVTSISEEIVEINSKIARVTKSKEDALLPVQNYDSEIAELNEKLVNIKIVIEKTNQSALMGEIETLRAKINKYNKELLLNSTSLTEGSQMLNKLTDKLEIQKRHLKQEKEKAEQFCERIEVTRDEADIKRDMDETRHKYALLEMELKQRGEDQLVVKVEYRKKKEEYIRHCALFKQIKEMYEANKQSVDQSVISLQKYLDYIKMKVTTSFNLVLQLRKFSGSLEIDLEQETMSIRMFDNMSTSCASGGERTFATIAFILALWNNMQLPFYSIDEYDVFMDNVNRLATTQLLLVTIEKRKNQFIFLTPQDISHIKSGPNIKVLKLKEPRS